MIKKISIFLVVTALFTLLGWGSLWLLTRDGQLAFNSPFFFGLLVIGGSAPTFSVFITIAVMDGRRGFKPFWKRLLRFKVPVGYYLAPILYLFFLGILPDLLAGELGEKLSALAQFNWVWVPVFLMSSFFLGGLEELGWRGLLQDELQAKLKPWAFHALIWLIWSVWHYPLFHIPGVSQYGLNFLHFSLYAILYSTLLGWLYGRTHSLPVVVFGHMLMNTFATIGILDFLWKESLNLWAVLIALAVLVAMHSLWPLKVPEKSS
jgi:uncharacterized protein